MKVIDYLYQYYGRPLDKEEDGECMSVTIAVYFMSFESIIAICRDGYVSKKAQNCSVQEFRAVLFV